MPLGEQPRRLSHVESTRVFALLTTHMGTNPDDGQDVESGHVRLLDDQTFERCDSYSLQPQETALSILTLAFDGEGADATFVAVGTAFARPDEPEPTSGRLLIFSVTERTLELKHELSTAGAVYSLEAFNGKLLAARPDPNPDPDPNPNPTRTLPSLGQRPGACGGGGSRRHD